MRQGARFVLATVVGFGLAALSAAPEGEVSLAIAGTGEGWNLGVSGSKFTIARK
jgi:hypothetical protein